MRDRLEDVLIGYDRWPSEALFPCLHAARLGYHGLRTVMISDRRALAAAIAATKDTPGLNSYLLGFRGSLYDWIVLFGIFLGFKP